MQFLKLTELRIPDAFVQAPAPAGVTRHCCPAQEDFLALSSLVQVTIPKQNTGFVFDRYLPATDAAGL